MTRYPGGVSGPYRTPSPPLPAKLRPCPRCPGVGLVARPLAHVTVDECPDCTGVFVDRATVEAVTQDLAVFDAVRERYPGRPDPEREVVYLACPRCGDKMTRRLFVEGVRVIIDVCPTHGTWFDARELTAVVEFVELRGVDVKERDAFEQKVATRVLARYESERLREQRREHRPMSAAEALIDLLAFWR